MPRESMPFDVVIVGAGPAGLSSAIRLAQLAQKHQTELSISVVEKGAEVGAHILSGAVFDPTALNELIPDWQARKAPLHTPVTKETFRLLTPRHAIPLPLPRSLKNHGNYIISLANLCRWLAEQAELLGVEIFPGFAATEVLTADDGQVYGIATGDMGRLADGSEGPQFEPGIELHSKQLILAEGCRGSLSQQVVEQYDLAAQSDPQTYGLGIKELWQIPDELHQPGTVLHSMGWPLGLHTYGGGFVYHLEDRQLAVGLITGLDYQNPWLDPFEEFQRFKSHPLIRPLLERGERTSFGARALSEGGLQALPRLDFPGGLLVGDAAGFLDVARLKGSHSAMKSGMLAAEAVFSTLHDHSSDCGELYRQKIRQSWLYDSLHRARNIRPAFRHGLLVGLGYAVVDSYLLRGQAPWTFHHPADHLRLRKAANCKPIAYPKPDNIVRFDRISSVFLANTEHDENQPVHLKLRDPKVAIETNLALYAAPEQRYCPAGVYEIINTDGEPHLQINAANCVHCKTCDIKDPTRNIHWTPPQGGSGPNYPNM